MKKNHVNRLIVFLALFSSVIAFGDSKVKHISATGSFGHASTAEMLWEVESDAEVKMAEACGGIEKVAKVENIRITLETSRAMLARGGVAGHSLLYFFNYPPSYLEADITCK